MTNTQQPITAATLAEHVGGKLLGDGSVRIERCRSLGSAGPHEVSFVSNIKYLKQLATTQAGCVVIGDEVQPEKIVRSGGLPPLTFIQIADPYFAFRQIMVLLHGFRPHDAVGKATQATVAASAQVGRNVNIHAGAVVGERVRIGDNTTIYQNVSIMNDAVIGEGSILYPGCVVYDRCVLGKRVILQAGAVIGCDGYGFATHQGVHHKIPQIGNVVLEDDVEVGANTVIERAAMESTTIGKGTKLGNLVVIGHNCKIGEHNLLVSQVGMAGSSNTGQYVVLAGQVGVSGHISIGNQVTAAAQAGITEDVADKQIIGGSPAIAWRTARKAYTLIEHLPEFAKRLRELEALAEKVKASLPDSDKTSP
ncbi:MAG: UDP-3-O-(3-hydroxymyristoyl)glucosamine N-acyltransferase [Phycisphaerae bacterium]